MGREVRRVPLDFDWPKDQVWEGYLSPARFEEEPCPSCYTLNYRGEKHGGSGATASAKWLDGICNLIGMMAADVSDQKRDDGVPATVRVTGAGGTERMHPYLQDLQKICIYEHRRPSADIVELADGLFGDDDRRVSFGYSFDVGHKVYEAILEAAGVDEKWGRCPTCDGHGSLEKYEGQRAEAESWEATEPPVGEGWQLWETVSEGSPISPVFDSPEGLASWMSSPAYTLGVSTPMQYDSALRFVTGDGWAPTLVGTPSGLVSGEQWVADQGGGK